MFMKTTCIPNLDLIPFGKGYSLNAEYIFANGDGVLCVEFFRSSTRKRHINEWHNKFDKSNNPMFLYL